MQGPWQEFPLSPELLGGLRAKVRSKGAVFSFTEEPLLAALVSCLGLHLEIGRPEWDRLSALAGIEIDGQKNPWRSEIISLGDEIGVRLFVPGLSELPLRHPGLADFLHPLSLSPDGNLSQLIIFPRLVAEKFRPKGLELVIVRNWALRSCLANGRPEQVNYFQTNPVEMETIIALEQADLLVKNQLAFFGTHDIADHLLGASAAGLAHHRHFHLSAQTTLRTAFAGAAHKKSSLAIAYLIGVILDDMAQPRWYTSEKHAHAIHAAENFLRIEADDEHDFRHLTIPHAFNKVMNSLRNPSDQISDIETHIEKFKSELSTLKRN